MQIVIPFAQVEAINPNLPGLNLNLTLKNYLQCIVVSCHSFRQNNPDLEIILVTNFEIHKPFKDILASLKVTIRIAPFTFNPSVEFGDTFRGCFYFFDALKILVDDSLIIDPDVICLGNIDDMTRQLGSRIGVFKPNLSPKQKINGISPMEARDIYRDFKDTMNEDIPEHIGGEAIFFPKKTLEEINSRVSDVWHWNVKRAIAKKTFLTTEEHILTCILADFSYADLDHYISRIWTTKSYKEIEGTIKDPSRLLLWHLPSEKNRGFETAFKNLIEFDAKRNFPKFDTNYYLEVMNLKMNFIQKCEYVFYRKLRKIFLEN